MKQDQWFEPGDKVMRVCYATELGFEGSIFPTIPETDYGKVLCVSESFEAFGRNRIKFVGIASQARNGWLAACFRKVEEIKLCVKAAQKVGEPVEVEPEFSQAPENTL